ncbi:MAG TPA: hypothetical protein DCW74_09755 [Alteromonas australica]|uniref:Uncharacterized protein n=1 Tax=Alteromonas australica TaxID=589873 RepID=A0A350P3Y6_9ALTE|nr:hypothetical protein [Alteromonas australica]
MMQRAVMGYNAGVITLNQALDMVNLPLAGAEGEERKESSNDTPDIGDLPREDSQEGASDLVEDE